MATMQLSSALVPGSAELAAVKARASAGDVAAMVRLAVDYYGCVVPEPEALHAVGPWTLSHRHHSSSSSSSSSSSNSSAAVDGPPDLPGRGLAARKRVCRSLELALLWLDRAAETGDPLALWTSLAYLQQRDSGRLPLLGAYNSAAVSRALVDKLRVVVAQRADAMLADTADRLLYGEICGAIAAHDPQAAPLELYALAAEHGSISTRLKYVEYCRRHVPDWPTRCEPVVVATARALVAAGASTSGSTPAPASRSSVLPTLAGADADARGMAASVARALKDLNAEGHNPASLLERADMVAALTNPTRRAEVQGGGDALTNVVDVPSFAARLAVAGAPAVGEYVRAMVEHEALGDRTEVYSQFVVVLAAYCDGHPDDAEAWYGLAVCRECEAQCDQRRQSWVDFELRRRPSSKPGRAPQYTWPFTVYQQMLADPWVAYKASSRSAGTSSSPYKWIAGTGTEVAALLKRAADAGHVPAMRALASLIVGKYPERAAEAVRLLEAVGDAASLTAVGQLYDAGAAPSLSANAALACRAWTRAVALPDAPATAFLALGLAYHSGNGVAAVDHGAACEYYELAAALGDITAACMLGILHEYNQTNQDLWAAFRWYRQACGGLPDGSCLDYNGGQEIEVRRMAGFVNGGYFGKDVVTLDTNGRHSLSPRTGVPTLDARIAAIERTLPAPVPVDLEETSWIVGRTLHYLGDQPPDDGILDAASKGLPIAIKAVLDWIDSGRGPAIAVPASLIEEWRAYGRRHGFLAPAAGAPARDSGNAGGTGDGGGAGQNDDSDVAETVARATEGYVDALEDVAYFYLGGTNGFPQDIDRGEAIALDLATSLVDGGVIGNLAELYTLGTRLLRDPSRALLLNSAGAALGSTYAMCQVGHALEHGDGIAADVRAAQAVYRAVLVLGKGGLANAVANLARHYHVGIGVRRDPAHAHRLYKIAATTLSDTATQAASSASSPLAKVADALESGQGLLPDAAHAALLRSLVVASEELTAPEASAASRSLHAVVLPAELWQHIFGFLTPRDLVSCRDVCAFWRAAVRALEAKDAVYAYPCAPVFRLPAVYAHFAAGRPLCTVPCTCGALLDAVTALTCASQQTARNLDLWADDTPAPRRGAGAFARHGGLLPPDQWRTLAQQRALATELGEVITPILPFYVQGALPVLGPSNGAGLFVDAWSGGVWSAGHVVLPSGVSVRSDTEMIAYLRNAVYGTATATPSVTWNDRFSLVRPTSLLTDCLAKAAHHDADDFSSAWGKRFGAVQLLDGIVLATGPPCDLADPSHRTQQPLAHEDVPAQPPSFGDGGAGDGRAGDGGAGDGGAGAGSFGALIARLDATSGAWADAVEAQRIQGGRRHDGELLQTVCERLGMDTDDMFADADAIEIDGAAHAQQGAHGRRLAEFVAAHLDLVAAVQCVDAPVNAILVGGFARRWGRRCLVYAVCPLYDVTQG